MGRYGADYKKWLPNFDGWQMSIRYKLFLIIGVLFCAIFIGSFVIENRIATIGIKEVRRDLLTFYKDLEEEKREYIDSILVAILSQKMGEVNAALEVVSKFIHIKGYFAPTSTNIAHGTWRSSASLIQDRESIDFVQNTYEGQVSSLIIPKHQGMQDMFQEPIDDDMSWIYTSSVKTEKDPPYLGISLQIVSSNDLQNSSETVPGIVLKVFVLYTQDALEKIPVDELKKSFSLSKNTFSLSVPFLEGYSIDIEGYLERISKAKKFLAGAKEDSLSFGEDENPLIGKVTAEDSCNKDLACYFNKRVEYVNQLFMIWELGCLLEQRIMGKGISSPFAPFAISFFPDETGKGQGVFVKDVLFETEKFDAKQYFLAHSKDSATPDITQGIAIISDPDKETLYMGNTAELVSIEGEEKKIGYLTLGFDLENVLQDLSLSFKQSAWIVANDKIIAGLLPSGQKISPPNVSAASLHQLLEAPMGVFSWQGTSYYFVHLQPYPGLDLHFFLFNEAEIEFSLMKKLNSRFHKIILKINEDRRYVIAFGLIILLLALLNLSKKITRPIIVMAKAARSVKRGNLSEIHLPDLKLGKKNEVQQLNEAFSDMVEGLKENEKVKGILNKVVSQDIAKEILKGEIHLGGEEREVTIFFADIRSFTSLTQKMDPKEVIALINTCMTKLSYVIDAHHGVIDKYIGDEVMVLFGAPLHKEDSAYQSVVCALEIMKVLSSWNIEREHAGLASVRMGIGIHTGKVCAGNMGAENRLNYTVIGSNVNLASRLCATAKQGEILISQDTLSAPFVAERVEVSDMGMLPLKGFDESKRVFMVKRLK